MVGLGSKSYGNIAINIAGLNGKKINEMTFLDKVRQRWP
jgi:hypothetical protein